MAMAGRTLAFHFDFGIADETGATLVWNPNGRLEACRHPALGCADALFFGQHRLAFVREALMAA